MGAETIKIRRFLGSLQAAFRLGSRSDAVPLPVWSLVWVLLRPEWRATVARRRPGFTVRFRFLGYDVESFSYTTLLMLFKEIFVTQVYSLAMPAECPVIVDAGANIGMATLFFKHRYPESRIWAFEPDPRAFALLERNVARNGLRNITLINAALSDRDGALPFYYDEATPDLLIMSVNPERLSRNQRPVTCVKGSTALPSGTIDFMKMDIEGAEVAVVAELAASGRMADISRLALEYHHGIGSAPSRLGGFLCLLEESGFVYSIRADFAPPGRFQDVGIAALRPTVHAPFSG